MTTKQKKQTKKTKKPIHWHDWMGTLFMEAVTGLGMEVLYSFLVTTRSPKGDILLIRNSGNSWSDEQRAYLPDGVRDCLASRIILDLKYTQSINKYSFFQIGYYAYRYQLSQKLKEAQVQPFLLSARTPQKSRLKRWGYERTEHAGVYRSRSEILETIQIISLNELSREPHNAVVKCFAMDPEERKYGLAQVGKLDCAQSFSEELSHFLSGLWGQWLIGEKMDIQLTLDEVMEIGELWGDTFLHSVPPEKILSRYQPEEILSRYKPEEILSRYQPEQRLAGLKPEQRLAGLKAEDIEAYLARIKRQNGSNGA